MDFSQSQSVGVGGTLVIRVIALPITEETRRAVSVEKHFAVTVPHEHPAKCMCPFDNAAIGDAYTSTTNFRPHQEVQAARPIICVFYLVVRRQGTYWAERKECSHVL